MGTIIGQSQITLYDVFDGTAGTKGDKGDQGPQGVQGVRGPDGTTYYTWVKYADSPTAGMSDYPDGKAFMGIATNKTTATESSVYSDYTWVRVKGEQGDRGLTGLQGPQGDKGVQGPKGADGVSTYTHFAYSNSADGTLDFSVSDPNRAYIGMYVDTVATDSTNPAVYNWTLVKGQKGDQGIQGAKGTDGKTPYFHIAYANNSTGTSGFSTTDSANKLYIGTYTDFVSADSTDPTKYDWTLVKGEKGDKGDTGDRGVQGLQGPKGDQGIQGPVGANGKPSYTHIAYANSADGTSGFSVSDPSNKTYIGIYVDDVATDSTTPSKYKWTLIKGQKGDQGIQGQAGADGRTPYFHTAWANNSTGTSGFSTTDSTNKLYIGTYTDFTVNDSTSPSAYKWTLVKGEKGDQGVQGIPGAKGADGKTTYTWVKYADDELGNGMSDYSDGKRYLGLAYNKTTEVESTNPADYSWSPLYDNVVVGGRNLLTGSQSIRPYSNNNTTYPINYEEMVEGNKQFYRITRANPTSNPNTLSIYNNITPPFTEELNGKTVTFSVYARSSVPKDVKMMLYIQTSDGVTHRLKGDNTIINVTSEWTQFSFTDKIDFKTNDAKVLRFIPYTATLVQDEANTFYLDVCNYKIEEGNVATSWTLAPEDLDLLIGEIGSNVRDLDERTQPENIVSTVVYDKEFTSIMNGKVNNEDISDMATGEMLTEAQDGMIRYVDGRIDGEGGINDKINEVSSSLTKSNRDITAKFQSMGGVNLVRNSLGFAGFDFWTPSTYSVITPIQNQELEQLGFGSGFYAPLSGGSSHIEQSINIQPTNPDGTLKAHSLSVWLKKTVDNATSGYALAEIWAGGKKIAGAGRGSNGGVTKGWELGIVQFTTEYSEIIIRLAVGTNSEASFSGLMINVGADALQWQHHPQEVYNTNVQMNLNGIKVLNGQTDGYTIMSPSEFSGYAKIVDDNGNASMERIFTLNGATTEVTQLDVDNELKMNSLVMRNIDNANNKGWAFISAD